MWKHKILGNEVVLTILHLNNDDAGTYTCEAIQKFQEYNYCTRNQTLDVKLLINCEFKKFKHDERKSLDWLN